MADRYLALMSYGAAALQHCSTLTDRVERAHGLVPRFCAPGLTVLAHPETPSRLVGSEGVVLGQLFENHAGYPDAAPRLSAGELRHGGAQFLRRYWGRYVGFAADDTAVGDWSVLRDPSGGMPVYHLRAAGVIAFVSDLGLAQALDLAPFAVSWDFVAHHLAYPELRLAQTGLTTITELLAGEVAQVSTRGVQTRCAWTPDTHAPTRRQTFTQACAELGEVITQCTGALARDRRRAALQLSGGLDSSIIASCLMRTSTDVSFINLMAPGQFGDERRYAQAVADACERPLHVIDLSLAPMLSASPQSGGQPALRPGPPSLFAEINAALAKADIELGAEAMFTGAGGDNVFAHLMSATPAVDRLLAEGPGRGFFSTLWEIAELKQATTWAVGGEALRELIAPKADLVPRREFMAADWAPERRRQHPWLQDARWTPPGRRARITAVLRIQHLLDPVLRPSPVPLLHPLLTQPVIETCLSIPSWLWVTGGIDRSAARAAFRPRLPELVFQRRGKGSLHAYFVKVYRQSRQGLRELLMGGVLVQRGFIDEGAVAAYLDRPDHKVDPGFYRLFELADVELWLRAWSAG